MIGKVSNRELKPAFQMHTTGSQSQVKRLEQAFQMSSELTKALNCDDPAVLGAAMISAARATQQDEIIRYGNLIAIQQGRGRID